MTSARRRMLSIGTVIAIAAAIACAPTALKRAKAPDGLDLIGQPIDTTISLGSWLGARPNERSPFVVPAAPRKDDLCATSGAQVFVGGATMTRYALFSLPDQPADNAFPSDSARFVRGSCRLHSVWIIRDVDDSAQADAFAESVRRALATTLGAATVGAHIRGQVGDPWYHAFSWHVAGTWIVLAVEPPAPRRQEGTGTATGLRRHVILVAYAPGSGFEQMEDPEVDPAAFTLEDGSLRDARVDSIMRLPGIPAVAAELHAIVSEAPIHEMYDMDPTWKRSDSLDRVLARLVSGTRAAARTLDESHRAAAFLQADVALMAYEGDPGDGAGSGPNGGGGFEGPAAARLRAAGLDLVDDGGLTKYGRSFLWDAYRADSLGAVGHLAFMELLSHGWSTTPNCSNGRNNFDRVIEHGEAAIARGDTDSAIHFYLAHAYRTIYSLGHGERGLAIKKQYGPRAEAARSKALAHFAAASPLGWSDGIHLLIRQTDDLAYYCTYD